MPSSSRSGMVVNPMYGKKKGARRLIKASGRLARKYAKEDKVLCKPSKPVATPKGRCVKKNGPTALKKHLCPPGMARNAKTHEKCVAVKSPMGKRLRLKAAPVRKHHTPKAKASPKRRGRPRKHSPKHSPKHRKRASPKRKSPKRKASPKRRSRSRK